MKTIGQTFSKELENSGLLGLPFSWGEDGTFNFSEEMSQAQIDAVLALYQSHNPEITEAPKSVTMRQARLALLQSGLLANVDAAINSLPSPQKEAAQIEWEYSQEVHRDKELVALLAPALGLDDTQLDALFVLAATL